MKWTRERIILFLHVEYQQQMFLQMGNHSAKPVLNSSELNWKYFRALSHTAQ